MIIEIKKLQHLLIKYTDEFYCFYYKDITVGGKKITAGSQVLLIHMNRLENNGVFEVDIIYDVTVYEYLSREFPIEYRKPAGWFDSSYIEHKLYELNNINSQSERKRFLYLIGDIYRNRSQGLLNRQEIILKHGEKLEAQKWINNKGNINASQKFFVRNSENGIIALGELESEDYVDETDLYRKKLNLSGAMLLYKTKKQFEIAPDFIPNIDIYNVSNPEKLTEEYLITNARLIIFNETISASHKEALRQLKSIDPFVRMMVIPPLSPDNISHILQQIKLVYNSDVWKKIPQ